MSGIKSIGEEAAVELFNSKWWEGKGSREIAEKQLYIVELICPFDVFHKAIEESLGRPVSTHEIGRAGARGILKEYEALPAVKDKTQ